MVPIRIILHPTDFSEHSAGALRVACSLARDKGARLIVLHVISPALVQEKIGFGEEMGRELERLAIPDPNIQAERRLLEGDAPTQILQFANETGCDLIVLGTHGRTGLTRLLMGSVAEEIVRRAPCPVLTWKSPQSNG